MAELGGTVDPRELIPGSPESVEDVAAVWQKRASLAEETGVSLRRFPDIEGWSGASADAFEARVQSIGSRWILLSDVLSAAVQALSGYAAVLRWAQQQAEVAIDAWEQGQAATNAKLSVPFPNGGRGEAIQAGAADRVRAQQILADARARVAAAGESAAASLREAGREPDLGEDVWDVLGKVTSTPGEALALLGGLTAAELTTVLRLRPEIGKLVAEAGPAGVNSWWSAFGEAERGALITLMPAVIGNLEGVKYADGAAANNIYLKDQLTAARADLDAAKLDIPRWNDRGSVEAYNERIAQLEMRVDALDNIQVTADRSDRFLISLSDDVPPLAAIAIGDPDQADNITFAVPGMGATTVDMDDWALTAQHLRDEQFVVDSARQHSVIAWVGYETPPTSGYQVLGVEYAQAGGAKLDASISGMQTVRGDAVTVNVAGHSYGTTTSSYALAALERPVDAFVSVGSAGLPPQIDQANDLHAERVFAGQATDTVSWLPGSGDAWAWVGQASPLHPVDPTGSGFGAEVFDVTGGDGRAGVRDHGAFTDDGSGYFDRDTQSLRNIALATTGQGDLVSRESTPAPPLLPIGTR